jgi:hypothetical protein
MFVCIWQEETIEKYLRRIERKSRINEYNEFSRYLFDVLCMCRMSESWMEWEFRSRWHFVIWWCVCVCVWRFVCERCCDCEKITMRRDRVVVDVIVLWVKGFWWASSFAVHGDTFLHLSSGVSSVPITFRLSLSLLCVVRYHHLISDMLERIRNGRSSMTHFFFVPVLSLILFTSLFVILNSVLWNVPFSCHFCHIDWKEATYMKTIQWQ